MTNAHANIAFVAFFIAAVSMTRAIRGKLRPGLGYYPKTAIQLEAAGKRIYLAVGVIAAAVGTWALIR